MGTPPELVLYFHSVNVAIWALDNYRRVARRGILVTCDIQSMLRLVKEAWVREPLKRLKAYLFSLNAWTEKEEEAWKTDCATRVDAEVNAYLETKSQTVEAIFDFTYAELTTDLRVQRDSAIRNEKPHD